MFRNKRTEEHGIEFHALHRKVNIINEVYDASCDGIKREFSKVTDLMLDDQKDQRLGLDRFFNFLVHSSESFEDLLSLREEIQKIDPDIISDWRVLFSSRPMLDIHVSWILSSTKEKYTKFGEPKNISYSSFLSDVLQMTEKEAEMIPDHWIESFLLT